jgi:hypothetical protein
MPGASLPTSPSFRRYCGEDNLGFQTQSYRRYFGSMIEEKPPVRRMSEKQLRARIDQVIAEEERTYGRLSERGSQAAGDRQRRGSCHRRQKGLWLTLPAMRT